MIIVNVKSIEEKRIELEEAAKQRERRRLEAEKEHEIWLKKRENVVHDIAQRIVDEISNRINKETEYHSIEYLIRKPHYHDYYIKHLPKEFEYTADVIFRDAAKIAIEVFKEVGYTINDYHEYSYSWRERSGKVGYFFIRIPE